MKNKLVILHEIVEYRSQKTYSLYHLPISLMSRKIPIVIMHREKYDMFSQPVVCQHTMITIVRGMYVT